MTLKQTNFPQPDLLLVCLSVSTLLSLVSSYLANRLPVILLLTTLPVCLPEFICPSACLYSTLAACLSVFLSHSFPVGLPVCLSLCLCICLSTFSPPNLLPDRSTIYLCSLRALPSNFYIHLTDIILGRQRI